MILGNQALWLLCGVGAAVFATVSRRPLDVLAAAAGFVLAAAFAGRHGVPDPTWMGSATAVVAAALLATSGDQETARGTSAQSRVSVLVATGCGGALAALSGVLLHTEGFPIAAALTIGAVCPGVASYLAMTRTDFAPRAIREEALVLVLGLGISVATVPRLLDGWRSALALNVQQPVAAGGVGLALPPWTLAVVAASIGIGGVCARFSRWRRR
jgi:hypothetical protein